MSSGGWASLSQRIWAFFPRCVVARAHDTIAVVHRGVLFRGRARQCHGIADPVFRVARGVARSYGTRPSPHFQFEHHQGTFGRVPPQRERLGRAAVAGDRASTGGGQARAVGTPPISLKRALVTNSLCRRQERRTIRRKWGQIGNPAAPLGSEVRIRHRERAGVPDARPPDVGLVSVP